MEALNAFLNQISLYGFAAILLIAAWTDFKEFLIPNSLVLAVLLLYPVYALTAPQPVAWLIAITIAGSALAVGLVLFTLKRLGGGDVKLMAATSLWAGNEYALDFFVITALAGGAISLALLLRLNYGWVIGWPAVNASRVVPYGAAIAAGGIVVAARLLIDHSPV